VKASFSQLPKIETTPADPSLWQGGDWDPFV